MNNKLYNKKFLNDNLMGPNSIMIMEELVKDIIIKPNMRILDLGCGCALTSLYLAQNYDVKIYATDLWIDASDNYRRIKDFNYEDKIIPIHADAINLPFAYEYFDLIISVDSYHYFGSNDEYLDKLLKYLKPQGELAIAVPGIKDEFYNKVPEIFNEFSSENLNFYFFSPKWWFETFKKSDNVIINKICEMDCFEKSWSSWLECDNEHAIDDRKMIEFDDGKYLNLVKIYVQKK